MSHSAFPRIARVALVLVLGSVLPASAEVQCGSPVLQIEDLRSWARTAALADRVAPHRVAHLASFAAKLGATDLREWSAARTFGAAANVDGAWQAGFGLPILNQYAGAAIEYQGELVVAGWLYAAGSQPVLGIARWTQNGWARLGEGIIPGFALAVLDGRLYAGSWIGAVSSWNGQTWSALPESPLDQLEALEVINGILVASGSHAGLGRVATFDGQQWKVLGADFNGLVTALGSYQGEIVAGGSFSHNGSTACSYVARWNGSSWTALGTGIDPSAYAGVGAIQEYEGRLIVGGWFNSCSGIAAAGLAAWDGQTWSSLEGVPPAYVEDLLVMDGKLYMAGGFAGDGSAVGVWDGVAWTSLALGQWVLGIARFGDQLAAVGGFDTAGCPNPRRMVGSALLGPDGWDGLERWEDTMHGLAHNAGAGEVDHAVVYRGELVVSGMFRLAGSPPTWAPFSGLARWDGREWRSVGPHGEGIPCPSALAVVGDDLIAGGFYSGSSPEGPLVGVGRMDGEHWHPLGSGLDGYVRAIAGYHGQVYAGGDFEIVATRQHTTLARFDGVEWSEVPRAPNTVGMNYPRVMALLVKDGLLYVGGNFDGPQGGASPGVVAWDGMDWRAVGSGVHGEVEALAEYRGQLFAGGPGMMRWDGAAWSSLGLDYVQVKCFGHYGSKLVVGGLAGLDRFAPGSLGLVAWDGSQWSGFGSGLSGFAETVCQLGEDLYVGGYFDRAGDQPSFGIARWSGSDPGSEPVVGPGERVVPDALALRSRLVTGDLAVVSYALPTSGHARLDLFDVRGARLATFLDRDVPGGEYGFEWTPGSPAPFPEAGVYFLRLTSGGRSVTARMIFVR